MANKRINVIINSEVIINIKIAVSGKKEDITRAMADLFMMQ